MGVEFDYAEESVEEDVEVSLDFSGITLPEALHTKLLEAAELYSVTEMEGYFNDIVELGEGHQELADYLRELRRRHDIESITAIIQDIRREG